MKFLSSVPGQPVWLVRHRPSHSCKWHEEEFHFTKEKINSSLVTSSPGSRAKVPGGIEETVFHQAAPAEGSEDRRIGIEKADPDYLGGPGCPAGKGCRYSDSAFVTRGGGVKQSTPRAAGAFGQLAKPDNSLPIVSEYYIVDKVLFPIDGEKVKKIGKSTGLSSGAVTCTCADIGSMARPGVGDAQQRRSDLPALEARRSCGPQLRRQLGGGGVECEQPEHGQWSQRCRRSQGQLSTLLSRSGALRPERYRDIREARP